VNFAGFELALAIGGSGSAPEQQPKGFGKAQQAPILGLPLNQARLKNLSTPSPAWPLEDQSRRRATGLLINLPGKSS